MATSSFSSVATLLSLFSLPLATNAALYDNVIHTAYGDVQGYPAFNSSPAGNLTNWRDITIWKGIPFAATTAGNNRFREPQPAAAWNSTLYASDWGPVCPAATSGQRDYTIDEDCLNLNIWSAANSSSAKLPVVMWSYPAESTAADALFNGGGMADKGVVFVNYNYLTGSFGWLSHPQLSEEFAASTGHNSSGNWGMLDQFAALKWIRANIADFGGDPDHITVMGQSAGSAATYHIVNSPLTKGLIVGAIIESGVRDPHDPLASTVAEGYISLEESLEQGIKFLDYLNISSPAWRLLEAQANGHSQLAWIITLEEYYADLNETYNDTWIQRFLDLYPANNSITASGAYNSQRTDRSKVGTYLWTQLWKKASNLPVYNYFWNHAPPGQTQGAYHEFEINYVLNNLHDTDYPWTSDDYEIAATMNSYWVNFIKTGNPNGPGLVHWPACGTNASVQVVGNEFQQAPVADPAKVKLYKEYFAGLKVY